MTIRRFVLGKLLLGLVMVAGCAGTPEPPAPAEPDVPGLTIEEYPLTDDPAQPLPQEAWKQLQPYQVKRKPWREPTPAMQDRFAAVQPGIPEGRRPDLYQPERRLIKQPFQVGSDIFYVRYSPSLDIQVVKNEAVVFSYTHPRAQMAVSPDWLVKGFYIWEGRWVLETAEGILFVDGVNLNQDLGYDEIFGFHFLQGRPFYFFKQGGKVGISYDGKASSPRYDHVPHYGCCDAMGFNPQPNGWMVSFFALRDGHWWYVEAGEYQP